MRTSQEEIKRRWENVRRAMEAEGIDALVVEGAARLDHRGAFRYLIDHYVLVFEEYLILPLSGPITLFAHDIFSARAAAEYAWPEKIELLPAGNVGGDPAAPIAAELKRQNVKRVGVVGDTLLSARFDRSMQAGLGSVPVVDFSLPMARIMMIKSPEEIRVSQEGVRLNEETYRAYLSCVGEGEREMDAMAEAVCYAQKHGCEDQYFMIDSGSRPVPMPIPAAILKNHVWKKGEYGVFIAEVSGEGGHYGETARMFCLGEPKPVEVEAYTVMNEAFRFAETILRPGLTAGYVADQIDRFFVENGFPDRPCGGRMGHGQGAGVFEWPVLQSGNSLVLAEGMRINLHPFCRTKNGVEIVNCDSYVLTAGGCRNLSTLPRQIDIVEP